MKQKNSIRQKHFNTMVDCITYLVLKGFKEDFRPREDGLQSFSTKKIYKPDEVKILNFYRFEGGADPADNSILYAIETIDGKHGTLSDTCEPYADKNVTWFMHEVEEMNRKREMPVAI